MNKKELIAALENIGFYPDGRKKNELDTEQYPKRVVDNIEELKEVIEKNETIRLEITKVYEIPREIGKMTKLRELEVFHTFIDKIPGEIGLLTNLRKLTISNNEFLRSIPKEIGLLTNLRVLCIRDYHHYLFYFLNEIKKLSNLEELEIKSKNLGRCYSLGNLKKLRKLTLHCNSMPINIKSLKNLEELEFSSTDRFTFALPKGFERLRKLKSLDVSNTRLQTLPIELAFLPKLEKLEFRSKFKHNQHSIKNLPIEYFDPKAFPKLNKESRDEIIPYDVRGIIEAVEAGNEECKICLVNKSNYVMDKCGHLACCGECKQYIIICPYCRSEGNLIYEKDFKGKIYKP